MLRTYVALQVIGCFIADGILTPESIPLPFFPKKESISNTNNSWHLLLKSATFRTLSRYTYFSPSLDMKMETDALLWEKLEGAKYIQKIPKKEERAEKVRTGLLVDMTRESGYLEFRQTETSRYNFEPRDHRILTLWKIQKLGQKHYIILIKIPQNPPIEDKYEYTIKDGLQELDTKDGRYTNTRQNKNTSWRSEDNKSARAIELHGNDHTIERQDTYVIPPHPTSPNKYKVTDNYKINKPTHPQTYVFKPTQYYTLLGFQTPPPPAPVPTYTTWNQPNDYYTVGNYKIFPEFKQEEDYNGFVPSLGPAGTPVYQTNPLEPIAYKQIDNYYPTYSSPRIVTTDKPIPITYFKPSAEFIQYSEADPFYTTDENHTYGPTVTAEMPTANPTSPIGEYQQIVYKSPLTSIVIDVPPLKPGESLYDSAINTIKNKTLLPENAGPTSTTLVINYPKNSNNVNEIKTPATEKTKETFLQIHGSSTTEKTTKIRVKNIAKSPHLSSLTKNDNYDNYAPLYIRWGEKIKPSENRTRTTTQKSVKIQAQKEVLNKPKEIITKEKITDLANKKEKDNIFVDEINDEKKETTTITVANDIEQSTLGSDSVTSGSGELNTTNYIIGNITVKSPEEIVRDLTTMGLVNATVIISDNRNEHFKTDNVEKLEIELPRKDEDNQEEGSEPISVVVNRISQSYSYKTAVGHIGNLKQLPEKT